MRIKIAGRPFSFCSNWGEMTIQQLVEFDRSENEIQKLTKRKKELKAQLEAAINWIDSAEIDNELNNISLKIAVLCVSQLLLLCTQPRKLEKLIDKGKVTLKDIRPIAHTQKIRERLGHLDEWYNGIEKVDRFKFDDFAPRCLLGLLPRKTVFAVHPLSDQTLVRDMVAVHISNQVMGKRQEFEEGRWKNLALFCGYICRPKWQEHEMSLTSKNRVVGGKGFDQLGVAEKMAYYVEKIDKYAEERAKVFMQLPLRIALGTYKQYFFFVRR